MQALGASGACHMGAMLLRKHYQPYKSSVSEGRVYIPGETWGEFWNINSSAIIVKFAEESRVQQPTTPTFSKPLALRPFKCPIIILRPTPSTSKLLINH